MNYKNAYVKALMEEEPTKKEAKAAVRDVKKTPVEGETRPETIEFEQGLKKKTPKKKYFGGATRPEDVDTEAAIADHRKKIKAAGQAALKKAKERRDAEDREAERKDESLGVVLGSVLKSPTAKKVAGKVIASKLGGGKKAQAGPEGVATGDDAAKKRRELQQQQASDDTLNAGAEYANAYVRALMERTAWSSRGARVALEVGGVKPKPNPLVPIKGGTQKHGLTSDEEKAAERKKKKKGVNESLAEGREYNNAYVTSLMEVMTGAGATAAERKADRERARKESLSRRASKEKKIDIGGGTIKPLRIVNHTEYHRLGKVFLEMCVKCEKEGEEAAKKEPEEHRKFVAYAGARRKAEHKRHGNPGETPRQTQVRLHRQQLRNN